VVGPPAPDSRRRYLNSARSWRETIERMQRNGEIDHLILMRLLGAALR
jgi:hypothetical protein